MLIAVCGEAIDGGVDVFSNGTVRQWVAPATVGEALFASDAADQLYRDGDGSARELLALADVGKGTTLFEVAVLDGEQAGALTGGVLRVGETITLVEIVGGLEGSYSALRTLLGAP